MGLKQLEWHPHVEGWIARTVQSNGITRRYAHVNLFSWDIKRRAGLVPAQFQFYKQGYDVTWHDSIEAAKLHVEAIFALDND